MIRKITAASLLVWSSASFAAHPLATDDVGTQERGLVEWEASAYAAPGDASPAAATLLGMGLAAHVGLGERVAVGAGLLHHGPVGPASWAGQLDLTADLKWRLFEFGPGGERGGFALRFDYAAPTGFDARAFGHGLGARAVLTLQKGPLEYHLNAGLQRSGLGATEGTGEWLTTVGNAVGFQVRSDMRVLMEAGVQKGVGEPSFTALGAVQWQPSDGVIVSAGADPAWSLAQSAAWTTALGLTFTAP